MRNLLFISLLSFLFLYACSSNNNNNENKQLKSAPIQAGAECHLCGMIINRFPGPKGQIRQPGVTRNFCSTMELMSYLLQEENKYRDLTAYVHDMGGSEWDNPDDKQFINARLAWYVVDSSKKGSMGKALASFAKKDDAELFMKEFGGKVLSFKHISL